MMMTFFNGMSERVKWRMHLVFVLLSMGLLYGFIHTYVKQLTNGDDEEISLAGAIVVLGSFYLGRFVAMTWRSDRRNAYNTLLVVLPLIMIACMFAMAFFANSLLSHREMIYIAFLVLPTVLWSIALGMFIKLIRMRIADQLQESRLAAVQSKTELALLQSQLSPHFLFNTLNNIYGLSIMDPGKIPPLLLRLSDLLRYTIYDSGRMFVPLKDELTYIRNYIDFESMRMGDRLKLVESIEDIEDPGCMIAPMLLIIFVENAFKHARNTSDESISIDIGLKLWGDAILFSVKNSFAPTAVKDEKGTGNGLGLMNAKKRLELLYPGQYDLKISETENIYSVMLRLNIKRNA